MPLGRLVLTDGSAKLRLLQSFTPGVLITRDLDKARRKCGDAELKLLRMAADFFDHPCEASAVIAANALENMLRRALALGFECGYPLLVLLPFRDQRAERIEGIRFRFAHFNLAPI